MANVGEVHRRHPALIPLTHDHHHTLHVARLLRRAERDGTDLMAVAQAFLDHYEMDMRSHFREEEEIVFPLVVRIADMPAETLSRLLMEHVRLHSLAAELAERSVSGEVEPHLLNEIGDLLRTHIHLEEQEMFPAVERLAAGTLPSIHLAPRTQRPATH